MKVQKLPCSEGTDGMCDGLRCCQRNFTKIVSANLRHQSVSDGLAYKKGETSLSMWRFS